MQTGIDVLEAHNFDPLRATTGKKKIGLLTNQTGVDSQGRRTIDVLAQAPGISLDAIFSPEHGVTGAMDTTDIANSKDAATGVPVYSVYGAKDAARRPSADVLKNLDAVVFDVQDVGTRFYTYETTLGYFLEAAAKAESKSSCSTAPIRSPAPSCRAPFPIPAAKASSTISPSRSVMA